MAQRAVRPRARRLRPSAWREALPVLRESETIKAAALAAAYVVAIGLGLVFTILAARILGDSYGALARITSFYLILTVPGLALQAAVAREVAVGDLGGSGALAASMRGWMRQVVVFGVVVVVAAVLLRAPLADLLHVDQEWAAATVPLTAVLWLAVSMQRGLLQGLRAYTPVGASIVGEGAGRLIVGVGLGAATSSVSWMWLGQLVALVAVFVCLAWILRTRLGEPGAEVKGERLRDLIRTAWVPIVGLTLLAVLQNADVIISGHVFAKHEASSYAAAAVAAKVPYWVAIGIALYLLPEATRRAAVGERPVGVLGRSFGLLAAAAIPSLLIFAVAAEPVLRLGFGAKLTGASDALTTLCLAYTMLSAAYLAVQYLLALRQELFLVVLAAAAALELVMLPTINVSLTRLRGTRPHRPGGGSGAAAGDGVTGPAARRRQPGGGGAMTMTTAVRAGLVVVAVAAVIWLGLGLRASRFEARAIALATHHPTPPRVAASLRELIDAEANNADTRPLVLQGELFLLSGQPKRAIVPLREVTRREPENFDAWRLLVNAADLSGNRALEALAQRHALALSPPVPTK